MVTEDQREQLASQWFQDTGGENIEPRPPNIERRSEEKKSLAEVLRTLIPAFSQREKEKERGGIWRLNPSISEEASATHQDSLSVKIRSKRG